ncbi:MAG TPA: hypothetical protein VGN52_03120 [Burkholderiales bacterium]|jgi:hypothetical protein
MLREIRNVKQNDPALTRRWFQSDYFDLFVWMANEGVEAGNMVMFQLCYDLRRNERAVSWRKGIGFYHDGVDDGERGGATAMNATAVLVADGPYDAEKVNARFLRESAEIPAELRKQIIAGLHEYTLQGPIVRHVPRRTVRRDHWQMHLQGLADLPREEGPAKPDAD